MCLYLVGCFLHVRSRPFAPLPRDYSIRAPIPPPSCRAKRAFPAVAGIAFDIPHAAGGRPENFPGDIFTGNHHPPETFLIQPEQSRRFRDSNGRYPWDIQKDHGFPRVISSFSDGHKNRLAIVCARDAQLAFSKT